MVVYEMGPTATAMERAVLSFFSRPRRTLAKACLF
jgi:hypothetical protein